MMRPFAGALGLALLLAGCAGGGSALRYYLLDPQAHSALTQQPVDLRIVDVEVPQYLERFQIARRGADNRVVYAMNDQWGEPLRENLLRVLAANLGELLATERVSTPLARLDGPFAVTLTLHLERFEIDVDGRASLRARWQFDGAQVAPVTRLVELRSEAVAAGGIGGDVRALQSLFGTLCEEIAVSIVEASKEGET